MRKMQFWLTTLIAIGLICEISWGGPGIQKFNAPAKTSVPEQSVTTTQATTDQSKALKDDKPAEQSPNYKLSINPKFKEQIRIEAEARKKTSAVPSPETQTILQGGDAFGDATVITGLPYTDYGTTAGYTEDYAISCAYGSPDVAYRYNPVVDGAIEISILDNDYYAAVGVFEDDEFHEVACSGYYIDRLPVFAGHAYYIVVSGQYMGSGNYTLEVFDPPTPPANDNCANATSGILNAGTPLTFTGELLRFQATSDNCPYMGSYYPEVWVSFTTTELMNVQIDYCGSSPEWQEVYAFIMSTCCDGIILADNINSLDWFYCSENENGGNPIMYFNYLPAGTYYIPIVFDIGYAEGQYVINVNGTPVSECLVECPSGSIMETEPNDGCWVAPGSDFETIANGATVCGHSWSSGNPPRTHDFDWYLFTLTENTTVNLTAFSDFRCRVGIVTPNSSDICDNPGYASYYTVGGVCDTVDLSVTLPSGTYAAVVYTSSYTETAFENGTYWLIMNNSSAPPAPANDRCEDITPQSLSAGQTITCQGNNTNALMNCPSNPWVMDYGPTPEVWEAFTITDTLNVTIDFCGTDPAWIDYRNILTAISSGCPCGDFIRVVSYDPFTCPDGNWTMHWYGLLPGTYYIPINSIPEFQQAYTMNIHAENYTTPPSDPCPRALFAQGEPELSSFYYSATMLCDPSRPDGNWSVVDDFVLPGSGDVTLDTAIFYSVNGTPGLYLMMKDPTDWDGLIVTIYRDNNGEPAGHPIADCGQEEDIPGGIVSHQVFQPGEFNYWITPAMPNMVPDWKIEAPLAPITLTAGERYWINVQAITNIDFAEVSFLLVDFSGDGMGYYDGVWGFWASNTAFCLLGPSSGGCAYTPGDINGNGALNGIDVTYGVSYFKGGLLPPYTCNCNGTTWYVAGDVNGNCSFNGIDITYLVSYFKGGAAPVPCPQCPPSTILEE
jgi:hypothetical protein